MSCSNCGGADFEEQERYGAMLKNVGYECHCEECVQCGQMSDAVDMFKLSPGEMQCLDCHCRDIDRAIDARYNI